MTRHALREVTQRQMINIVAARRRKGQDEETGDDESKYKAFKRKSDSFGQEFALKRTKEGNPLQLQSILQS